MLEVVGQCRLHYRDKTQGILGSLVATPSLISRVIESQGQDIEIAYIRDRVKSGIGDKGWTIHTDGSLRYRGRIVVPRLMDLREEILKEFHCSCFAVHPIGINKIIYIYIYIQIYGTTTKDYYLILSNDTKNLLTKM